jgi:hypothetical protein
VESLSSKGGDNMVQFNTVEKAKGEIEKLQHFIHLVESYETDTLDKAIIKEYAITNSIPKTISTLNTIGYAVDNKEVDHDYVVSLLKKIGKDELHKHVRSVYMKKTKYIRSTYR